jgi:acyl-CoA thioesterase I
MPVKDRRPCRWAIALCLFVAACGERVPRLAGLPPDAVIVAFGDSLTYGTGADTSESYPARLQVLIGRKVINAGVSGELSAEGAARLPQVLDKHQPRLLLLCHGGNDLLRRLDPVQTAGHLRGMIRAARGRGVEVLLIAVPQPGLWLSPAPFYKDLAEELGLPLERGALSRILSRRELKSDTVHPNAAGYLELAQAVARLLQRAGALEHDP